jgi:ureidoglycolate hydrolase
MIIPSELLETGSCFEQKFQPVMVTGDWQVAVLRQCEKVMPGNIRQIERHNNTEELFVLTLGKAFLIVVEETGEGHRPFVIRMQHNVVYNIKKSVWHHIVISDDAHVLIFEKADTSRENSDYTMLDDKARAIVRDQICF